MHFFCGQTDAVDQDVVLGEGRWIGFIAPEQALNRDLVASASLLVPMFTFVGHLCGFAQPDFLY